MVTKALKINHHIINLVIFA